MPICRLIIPIQYPCQLYGKPPTWIFGQCAIVVCEVLLWQEKERKDMAAIDKKEVDNRFAAKVPSEPTTLADNFDWKVTLSMLVRTDVQILFQKLYQLITLSLR
jgi:hypothetical protein